MKISVLARDNPLSVMSLDTFCEKGKGYAAKCYKHVVNIVNGLSSVVSVARIVISSG